ncbi:hypothetical protein NDU88_004709 [Pleurodeles waltl]|uniref:Uncharacterized protein n=1 Tax=Pleurodeles waltl TaxID=8319 RepID=A0AAV7MA10_PLEWA|nr:hypothetical protein NDU88_004709 [Pleurodeles waltl]
MVVLISLLQKRRSKEDFVYVNNQLGLCLGSDPTQTQREPVIGHALVAIPARVHADVVGSRAVTYARERFHPASSPRTASSVSKGNKDTRRKKHLRINTQADYESWEKKEVKKAHQVIPARKWTIRGLGEM